MESTLRLHIVILSIVISLCYSNNGICQSDHIYNSAARNIGLANAGASIGGIESMTYNAAGMITVENWAIIASAESRFTLQDLTSSTIGIVKNVDNFGAIGLVFSNFGLAEYKQQNYGLSYARLLSSQLSVGVQFGYYSTQISEYGSASRFGLSGGLRYTVADNLILGASTARYLEDLNGENLETHNRLGFSYKPGAKIWVHSDISLLGIEPQSLHLGLEYIIAKELSLRLGMQTRPALFSVGISYAMSTNLKIDGSISSHQNLGSTPAASIIFQK